MKSEYTSPSMEIFELEENDKYSIMYRVHIQDIGWRL